MSEREKHEIIGSTVIELKACRSNLAALEVKARALANAMRNVAQDLSPVSITYGPGSLAPDTAEGALAKYPDRSDVVALQKEIGDTRARIEALSKSLQEMGA